MHAHANVLRMCALHILQAQAQERYRLPLRVCICVAFDVCHLRSAVLLVNYDETACENAVEQRPN